MAVGTNPAIDIVPVEGPAALKTVQVLFEEYWQSFGFTPCFQNFGEELAGLPGKGAIAPGRDADLVAFDDTARFTVDPSQLEHRHPVTPYAGQTLTGVVRRTWLRGRAALAAPAGRLLTRQ